MQNNFEHGNAYKVKWSCRDSSIKDYSVPTMAMDIKQSILIHKNAHSFYS